MNREGKSNYHIVAQKIISILVDNSYVYFTGVPCSLLKGLFNILEQAHQDESLAQSVVYIPAIREDSALGLAAGIYLAGKKTVVLMQNSGLGYSLNVLTSLNLVYDIPTLLIIGWRGADDNDSIEHRVIGQYLPDLLKSINISYFVLDILDIEHSVGQCINQIERQRKPVALLIRDGV